MKLTYTVLGVATITLNGKATQGSDLGSKVERAMELVAILILHDTGHYNLHI
jgi:predicted HD phosphohydrolase